MTQKPYSPDELRALIKWKGWSHKQLAAYWNISQVHVSRIINDPDRAVHWNDAVVGLPRHPRLLSDLAARQARVASLMLDPAAVRVTKGRVGRPPLSTLYESDEEEAVKAGSGYRHRGYVVVGSILTVANDLGDALPAGERGIVFAVEDTGVGERYGVIFENGEFHWFLPIHLDSELAGTGLDAPGLDGYRYQDDKQLVSDFNSGRFLFW